MGAIALQGQQGGLDQGRHRHACLESVHAPLQHGPCAGSWSGPAGRPRCICLAAVLLSCSSCCRAASAALGSRAVRGRDGGQGAGMGGGARRAAALAAAAMPCAKLGAAAACGRPGALAALGLLLLPGCGVGCRHARAARGRQGFKCRRRCHTARRGCPGWQPPSQPVVLLLAHGCCCGLAGRIGPGQPAARGW